MMSMSRALSAASVAASRHFAALRARPCPIRFASLRNRPTALSVSSPRAPRGARIPKGLRAPAHELPPIDAGIGWSAQARSSSTRSPPARASPPRRCWRWPCSRTCRACSCCRRSTAPRSSMRSPRAACWSAAPPSIPATRASASPSAPSASTGCRRAPAKLLGRWAWDDIATYRLPSLLAGILAVLATWWLTRPLLGDRRAVIAAALFAVSPIVALQATLSIPEGPLLLAIVVAQLALLRLYCAPDSDRDKQLWLALAFWAAQGGGMLLNALAVPILSLATIIALYVMDRRARLAVAPAPADRRAADAGHRRAVAAHPRAFRRRRAVQRAHLGRVHPRPRRRPGHEMEGGAAHLHAGLPARLPARRPAAVAGAAEPVARARRTPCSAFCSPGSSATGCTWS